MTGVRVNGRDGTPKGGFAYLAYPIDQAGDAAVGTAVGQVTTALTELGWGTFNPGAAFTIGKQQQPSRYIARVDHQALAHADALVAFLPAGVASVGVPIELERAAYQGKPVLVLAEAASWMLAGYANYPNVRLAQPGEPVEKLLLWLVGTAESQPQARAEILPTAKVRPTDLAVLPTRQYDGDAGFDLVVSETTEVEPGKMVDIPCNLAVELPDWAWGLIVGRSSTLRTKRLQVHPGIIDGGYRGELFAAVSCLDPERAVRVEAGERLAQLIVMSNQSRLVEPLLVGKLNVSDRGSKGFGSTGR